MVRRGSFTSAAVKVMVFHASLEKIAPTIECRSPPEAHAGQGFRRYDLSIHGAHHAGVPEVGKVPRDDIGIAADGYPEHISPTSATTFARVKTSCTIFPPRIPRVFMYVRSAMLAIATHCAADTLKRPRPKSFTPSPERERRPPELGEGHRYGGDSARLDHHEERPAVRRPQADCRPADEHVLPPRPGHEPHQLPEAERADDGDEPCDKPDEKQVGRRADVARDVGAHYEDARADHRAHNEQRRVEKPELAPELYASHASPEWAVLIVPPCVSGRAGTAGPPSSRRGGTTLSRQKARVEDELRARNEPRPVA